MSIPIESTRFIKGNDINIDFQLIIQYSIASIRINVVRFITNDEIAFIDGLKADQLVVDFD